MQTPLPSSLKLRRWDYHGAPRLLLCRRALTAPVSRERRLRRFKVLVDAGVFLDLPVFTPPPPPADYRMRSIAQVG